MNPTLPFIDSKVEEIFVLGFEGTFSECLISHTTISDDFEIKEFENSFLTFQALEGTLQEESPVLPKAIICEFGSMQEESFLLLKNIKAHPLFRYLPIIAMNRDGLNHKMSALHLGFDDYYDVPVDTEVLKERIEFLASFKEEIETCETPVNEVPAFGSSLSKRIFDVLFASAVLLALSPILLLVAILIKIESPGPIIYRSKRVGTGYRVFDFLKFRSMYRDADQRLKDLKHLNQYDDGEDALFVKFANDPRITKVGKLIRKTSIDELPQLLNVIKGDMSIVGNRPLPLYEAELLTRDRWAKRFLAPAGLTGLWQVTKRGKGDMSTEERIGLDVSYAEKNNFWYDIKLILKTPFALIQEENV